MLRREFLFVSTTAVLNGEPSLFAEHTTVHSYLSLPESTTHVAFATPNQPSRP